MNQVLEQLDGKSAPPITDAAPPEGIEAEVLDAFRSAQAEGDHEEAARLALLLDQLEERRLDLIDGSYIVMTNHYSKRLDVQDGEGRECSGAYGLALWLRQHLESRRPKAVAVALEGGRNWRHELHADYKANRSELDEDLKHSLDLMPEICRAFGVAAVRCEGFEGDDVLGTLAALAEAEEWDCRIYSSDKDLLQLISAKTHIVRLDSKRTVVDARRLEQEKQLSPRQMADYLALMGDSADNIPGAPGIGAKFALQYLLEYGSLEAVLERSQEIKREAHRKALKEHREQIEICRRLVEIRTDAPVGVDLEALLWRGWPEGWRSALRDLGLPELRTEH